MIDFVILTVFFLPSIYSIIYFFDDVCVFYEISQGTYVNYRLDRIAQDKILSDFMSTTCLYIYSINIKSLYIS